MTQSPRDFPVGIIMTDVGTPEQCIRSIHFVSLLPVSQGIIMGACVLHQWKGMGWLRRGSNVPSSICISIRHGIYIKTLPLAGQTDKSKSHPGYKGRKLNHLTFANDLWLFCQSDEFSIQHISDVVKDSSNCSGIEAATSNELITGMTFCKWHD